MGSHAWILRAEKIFIVVAWLMGISMIAQGAVHLAFLNPDFRPADDADASWARILSFSLIWELPTGASILGGLIYQSRRPRLAATLVALGVVSYSIHFRYFVVIPILAFAVIATVLQRSRRLARQQTSE